MDGGFRSLGAPGVGAEQATQTLLEVLGARDGYTVHLVAPGRINLAVSRRPGWAVLACLATVWIAGLGLFFLLVRRTEAGEIGITDGPRGCVVTLPPVVDGATASAISDALAPTGPTVAAPPPARSLEGDGLDDATVARGEAPPPPPPPPAAVHPAGGVLELRFAAGTVLVEAGTPVVLGRDPSPVAHGQVRRVPGDASSISKSHLRAAFDGTELTVEDLGSTNGSRIRRAQPDGREVALVPGAPAVVAPGDTVLIGALAFTAGPVEPSGPAGAGSELARAAVAVGAR